jgi:hypothetical protein
LALSRAAPRVHTVKELVAAGLGSRSKILELIRTGTLPAKKIGRITIVLDDDLWSFLSALPSAAKPLESISPDEKQARTLVRGMLESGIKAGRIPAPTRLLNQDFHSREPQRDPMR